MKTPKTYQDHGSAWLALREGSILGFAPGLGKTMTAILAVQVVMAEKVLIVCPLTLKEWWVQEILDVDGPGQVTHTDLYIEVRTAQRVYVLAHYQQFVNGKPAYIKRGTKKIPNPSHLCEFYLAQRWDAVIADECQYIKNRQAQRTRWMGRLKAKHKWGLTGTPLAERPDDLWAILHWVAPKAFPSYWNFVSQYWEQETGYTKQGSFRKLGGIKYGYDPETQHYTPDVTLRVLQQHLKPYLLVKRLADVGVELPPITHTTLPLKMGKKQAAFYKDVQTKVIIELTDELGDPEVWDLSGENQLIISAVIARFTRLIQTASAPTIFKPNLPNIKLDWLKEYLDGGQPSVIMTRFNHTADMIKEVIRKAGREQDFMVGTYGKLAEGHNLQHYNQIIGWDAPQSRQQFEQAYHRVHRLGQERPQQFIRLVAQGTIDEHCWRTIDRKEADVSLILEWLRGVK